MNERAFAKGIENVKPDYIRLRLISSGQALEM
jgi:hypothetical protein